MRVALVHDWLTGFRGGERVLHEFALEFPGADLYTLIHVPGSTTRAIERLNVKASFLSRIPGSARHYRKLLPLFPRAIESFELQGYDLVLSCSHAVAKGIRISGGTPHLCYCLTPMRYVWDQADAYLGRGALRLAAAPLVSWLRSWDRRTSTRQRIDQVVAISAAVADRVGRCWGRQASVIHPPVDVDRIRPSKQPPESFFLLVGGFVPYKREALAIAAFAELGLPLVVAGDGPSRARLEANAPAGVRFTGRVSDAELASLYARCRALIYPQEEDFGIVAVEAQAAGRPVIAFGRGGACDTVVPLGPGAADPTGIFFEEASPAGLAQAVREFEKHQRNFDPSAIRRHAESFGRERFRTEIMRAVYRTVGIGGGAETSETGSGANSSTRTEPPG